ncbi:tetratricopeptide repeat protein [Saccharothrix sp. HUAS TT1]|uniref:CHAT domain-containing tetratricopeptide repeat protein n=1 Tax=unclassified Saccharothrix TaxID=2593673 RepID=UPI00345C0EC9
MADRLLVDVGGDGRVSVTAWLDGELPTPAGPAVELGRPLGEEELDELRWYLEDYLRAPFGVYESRGPEVAGRLPGWGEAMFAAVFGAGAARDAYVAVRSRMRGPAEIVVRSAAPGVLGLPWELMRDPAVAAPLVLDGFELSRSVPSAAPGTTFEVGGDRLRVLMVISRPAGASDVGYRMIARPLVRTLEVVRGRVELVVLRPPTLAALERALAEAEDAGRPFQVVHFDGHGVLTGARAAGAGAPWSFAADGEGVLAFERDDGGGADHVPAERIGQVLACARVPLVVLNACQSGAVGRQLEAAVATRLLAGGASAVVAMAYSVYAVAAAEFMTAFYERLFVGDSVSQAVRVGRARMAQRPERPSLRGPLPLADWVVPVHYLRRDVRFPELRSTPGARGGLQLGEALDRVHGGDRGDGVGDRLAPTGEFVGRDGLFHALEVAARTHRAVVLHGTGGTGKTELAKAFGRWWRDTGAVRRPEWVVWHSFEPGVASFGLDGVLATIGLALFGAEFSRLDRAQRVRAVLTALANERILVIWDNFESVATMPDPTSATPALSRAAREELRDFLRRLTGSGLVLITSRTAEDWLGEVRRIRVDGLGHDEAVQYADQLLAPYPTAAARRGGREFADLLHWLNGHPLSMRVILPHLAEHDPGVVLAGLRGTAALPRGHGAGRTGSLTESIDYSLAHLDPGTRRALHVVCLFHGVVDLNVLGAFSRTPDAPAHLRELDAFGWQAVLDRAAEVGLLTALGGVYAIHPALPTHLAEDWRTSDPDHHDDHRAAAEVALLHAHATFARWLRQQLMSGEAGVAHALLDLQRQTLGHFLGLALANGLWPAAQAMAEALDEYWELTGQTEEARAWVDRGRHFVEDDDGTPPPLDTPAGGLWLYLVSAQADRHRRAGAVDAAHTTYTEIAAVLDTHPDTGWKRLVTAITHHQLGKVAHTRGRLDDAERLHRLAISAFEQLGHQPGLAHSYHQLGMVAHTRGDLDSAGRRYRQALATSERIGDRPNTAASFHQLGLVAELRGQLDDAERWHRQALAIFEQLGDRPNTAASYHHLGIVAQLRRLPDDAEQWFRQSLVIFERIGDRHHTAASYHQLGMVAELRERLDDAEHWYRRSTAIKEALGDRPGVARTYAQLGLLAERRGDDRQALDWALRCIALFPEFPHPYAGTAPRQVARLADRLGEPVLESRWVELTGDPLPDHIRTYVRDPDPENGGDSE